MIDTKKLRACGFEYEVVCDELDRLYLDTAPLSREDLEGVLKEAGYINTMGQLWENKDWLLKFTSVGNLYANHDTRRCQLDLPLSAVTRRLLRDCGVIA